MVSYQIVSEWWKNPIVICRNDWLQDLRNVLHMLATVIQQICGERGLVL
jgi:hypothetical protein